MSKKEIEITGQLSWQGKAQTHRKNSRFFRPAVTEVITIFAILIGRSHSDLSEKKSGNYLTPKVLTKNLGTVQNSTPKHVTCPEYVMYWKISQVILRSKFLTIGKYQKNGHYFGIQPFSQR